MNLLGKLVVLFSRNNILKTRTYLSSFRLSCGVKTRTNIESFRYTVVVSFTRNNILKTRTYPSFFRCLVNLLKFTTFYKYFRHTEFNL